MLRMCNQKSNREKSSLIFFEAYLRNSFHESMFIPTTKSGGTLSRSWWYILLFFQAKSVTTKQIGSKLKRSINVTYYSFLSRDSKENKFSKKNSFYRWKMFSFFVNDCCWKDLIYYFDRDFLNYHQTRNKKRNNFETTCYTCSTCFFSNVFMQFLFQFWKVQKTKFAEKQ